MYNSSLKLLTKIFSPDLVSSIISLSAFKLITIHHHWLMRNSALIRKGIVRNELAVAFAEFVFTPDHSFGEVDVGAVEGGFVEVVHFVGRGGFGVQSELEDCFSDVRDICLELLFGLLDLGLGWWSVSPVRLAIWS